MLKNKVFLTSTDTTIGFISQDSNRLNKIKQRLEDKKFIKALDSLDTFKNFTRAPNIHKKRVRRAKKTTFIIKDESYRIIDDSRHLQLLRRLKWAYTTSANLSGAGYNENFAKENADIIIYPLIEGQGSSKIYKLSNKNIKKIR
ncbi:MAG: Sua5 YciO YrdC YwlC family protein [Campylobacterales bacterium]|nr:Sua5 YciO YrdC YwlC family protein [Campylobacterales bacterium]